MTVTTPQAAMLSEQAAVWKQCSERLQLYSSVPGCSASKHVSTRTERHRRLALHDAVKSPQNCQNDRTLSNPT